MNFNTFKVIVQYVSDSAREQTIDWSSIIVQLLAAFIGAGAAILVYYLGEKKTSQKAQKQKTAFETDKLIYLHHLISQSVLHLESFHKGLIGFNTALKETKLEFGSIRMKATYDITRLVERINQEEHFHSYRNRVNDKNISSIFSNIDLGDSLMKQVISLLEERKIINQDRKKEIAQSIEKIRDKISKQLYTLRGENIENHNNRKIAFFDHHLKNYGQAKIDSDGNLVSIFDTFVKPFSEQLFEKLREWPNMNIDELFASCANSNSLISNAKKNNELLTSDIDEDIETLRKIIDAIKQDMRPFDELISKYDTQKSNDDLNEK